MTSEKTAARMIAGMLQGRVNIGPVWDSLDKSRKDALIRSWENALREDGDKAVENILNQIKRDEKLGPAWNLCGPELHSTFTAVIGTIAKSVVNGVDS